MIIMLYFTFFEVIEQEKTPQLDVAGFKSQRRC